MFKLLAISTLLSFNSTEINNLIQHSVNQVISQIPTDPSLIGECSVDLNGCIVLPSNSTLKEWYSFSLTSFNFANETEAKKFCGMNSSNLIRLHLDYSQQKGYVQLFQSRLGAPTTIESWNTYFTNQCH